MKTMIYRAFSLILFCLTLVSCKDDFDIQNGGLLLSYRR